MRKVIDRFRDEYECFSNFYIEKDGLTVEHRFQADKSLDPAVRKKIMQASSPQEAKKLGRNRKLFTIRPDWEQVKDSIMENLVREKFLKDKVIMAELLATGEAEIIHGRAKTPAFRPGSTSTKAILGRTQFGGWSRMLPENGSARTDLGRSS